MKKESTRYIKWASMLCLLLTCFCVAMILVHIKPLSTGQVATTATLAIATVALAVWHRKRIKNENG